MDSNNHLNLTSLVIVSGIANKSGQGHQSRNSNLWYMIVQQFYQSQRCTFPDSLPLRLRKVIPQLRNQQRRPVSHQWFRRVSCVLQHFQTNLHDSRCLTRNLALSKVLAKYCENKSTHGSMLGDGVFMDMEIQHRFVGGLQQSDEVCISVVFE